MKNKKSAVIIIITVTLCCAAMAVTDGIIKPPYLLKSIIKLALFMVCPVICSLFDRDIRLAPLLKPDKRGLITAALLGVGVYTVVLGAYFVFRNVFDFSGITASLTSESGVSRDNFIFVALYISFVNSLLEEFFFRGFAFLTLKKSTSPLFAYVFGSAAFALYHVAMMIGWFSIWVYLLVMLGLLLGALIFNWIDNRFHNIYVSWIVHMFANFAVNTVGLILFGLV